MQKKETKTVLVTYCEVCGCECGNYSTMTTADGIQHHACHGWTGMDGERHDKILAKRLKARIAAV